jgi:hypothetical protein
MPAFPHEIKKSPEITVPVNGIRVWKAAGSMALAGLLLLLLPGVALAGQFGLEMGMTLEQLKKVCSLEKTPVPNYYSTAKVPSPDPLFKGGYRLRVDPDYGLVEVAAYTEEIKTDIDGTELKKAFHDIEGKLEKRFGKGKFSDYIDFLFTDWTEKDPWMMSLADGGRIFRTDWKSSDKKPVPNGISNVHLQGIGRDEGHGILVLTYVGNNSFLADAPALKEKLKKSAP